MEVICGCWDSLLDFSSKYFPSLFTKVKSWSAAICVKYRTHYEEYAKHSESPKYGITQGTLWRSSIQHLRFVRFFFCVYTFTGSSILHSSHYKSNFEDFPMCVRSKVCTRLWSIFPLFERYWCYNMDLLKIQLAVIWHLWLCSYSENLCRNSFQCNILFIFFVWV